VSLDELRDTSETTVAAMQRFLHAELPPGCVGAIRAIREDDDRCLTAAEPSLGRSIDRARRASGAARDLARTLADSLGAARIEILRQPSRAPSWPPELVGSLAHDARYAAAVVARAGSVAGIGIDVEAPEALEPSALADIRGTLTQLSGLQRRPVGCVRLLVPRLAPRTVVGPKLGRFVRDYPDVVLDITTDDSRVDLVAGRL
jgi:4'-phosphopantetheinyl transferase EntD